jgi:predicted amidohydrolase
MDVGPDRTENLRTAWLLTDRAARGGADIVCLPELFSFGGPFRHPRRIAESKTSPSVMLLRRLAEEYGISIVAGSILERTPGRLPLNTCFFIGPTGKIVARYSKLHLFDIHIPGKILFRESKSMRRGRHATVAATPFGIVGFAICNDLRYPELFRRMATAGARIIFVPSAFTKFTGREHWIALNRVRAIENQCYVAAVNQSGKNAAGVHFFGSSVIVDPWGKILKEGPPKGDALVSCTIDLARVDEIRRQLPALKKILPSYPLKRMG